MHQIDYGQFLKQNLGHAWEYLAESWNHLTRKATTAITRFTSDGKDKYSGEEHKQLAIRNAG